MGATFDPLLGQLRTTDAGSSPATFTANGTVKQTVYNVRDYGAVGNGTTDDMAAIQSAINAAQTAGGGVVYLSQGTYKVTSSSRLDTVSYTSGTTITDSSIGSTDIGSYCIGVGINGRVPQITAVTAGVSFTVDVAPSGTPTSLYIVSPGFVLPEGVKLLGAGSAFTTNGFGSSNPSVTKIQDSGTGITCLIRGGSPSTGNTDSRYGLEDLSIWGPAGTGGNDMFGVYVGNMSWFLTVANCDISYHGTAGMAFDGNVNSHDIRNTNFLGNAAANSSATTYTGGVVMHPYYVQSSAGLNFYNCFFNQNYGWGITDGSGSGAFGVHLWGCQWNNTRTTSATGSGVSAALQSSGLGNASIYGGWSESAALYDVTTTGSVTISDFHLYSSIAYGLYVISGTALIAESFFAQHTTASVLLATGANVNWIGVTSGDPIFYSGGPALAGVLGIGSSRYGTPTAGNILTANANGEGSWLPGYAFTPVTTNYVINPSFENASYLTAWTAYGSSGTLSADSTTAYSGTVSSKQVNSSAMDGGIICSGSMNNLPAGTYTFSVYAKIQSTVTNASMILRVVGGSQLVQINQSYPGNTNWNRYSGSFTLASTTSVEILLGLGSYGGTSVGTVNYDAVQVELGSSATTYFDGSTTQTGYTIAWTGTANDSTSTRTVGSPTSPATTTSLGTIELAGDLGGTATSPTVKGIQRVFNVKDAVYGAVGNGKQLSDGAVSASSTTFTSATAAFTSADTGKVINIYGAGVVDSSTGFNYGLTTTITYVSSTQVTLATAATATVSGANFSYGTDDSTAINTALAAASSGGIVFFPAGNYIANALLTPISNTIIEGTGVKSLIIFGATKGFYLNNLNNVIIRNMATDSSSHSYNDILMEVKGCNSITVEDCNLLNCGGFGIFTHVSNKTASNFWYRGNFINGFGGNDLIGGGIDSSTDASILKNIYVDKNTVIQDASLGHQYSPALDITGVFNTSYTNNRVSGDIYMGIEQSPNSFSSINHNLVTSPLNKAFGTVTIVGNTSATSATRGDSVQINGNVLQNSAILLQGSSTSIRTYRFAINDNIVNAATTGNTSAIHVLYGSLGSISNNVTRLSGVGILLDNSDHVNVGNNNLMDHGTAGIKEVTADHNLITNNELLTVSVPTPVTGISTTSVVKNNMGINPELLYALGTTTTTTTVDRLNGNVQTVTLGGNTAFTFNAPLVVGDQIELIVTQDATGSRVPTFSSNVKFAQGGLTFSTTASAVDVVSFAWDGTYWRETSRALSYAMGAAPTGTAGGDLVGTYPNPTLVAAGTAGTYAYPSSIVVDSKGRTTSITAGSTPTSGTVISVALSGGTTGLTVSGSPITASGTITLAGTLALANGGTGSATQNFVDLTSAQTIAGVKTFSSQLVSTNTASSAPAVVIGSSTSQTAYPWVDVGGTASNYGYSVSQGRVMIGHDSTGGAAVINAGAGKGFQLYVGGTNGTFLSGTKAFNVNTSTGYTYFGSTTTTPTAQIHIGASTTSAASLRLTSGVAPTTPNAGDMWYDGTNFNHYNGTTTQTFVDQQTTQTVAGAKTFSTSINVTGLASLIGATRYALNTRNSAATLTPGTSSEYNTSDATSGAITITLAATASSGYAFEVIKIDSGANAVTVDAGSGNTINGTRTYVLATQYKYVRVMSTGTSGVWYVMGNN